MSDDIYRIKNVVFNNKTVPILMQNINGPCPILAISNVLLLQGKIRIHSDQAFIDFSQLLQLVADYLVESNPPHADAAMQANQQQQIADALSVLPKLGRGLDVNLRFTQVTAFEYTDELSVFDMLGVTLLHGWLYDPQDVRAASVIQDMSYNQLICMLVDADSALEPRQPAQQQQQGGAGGGDDVVGPAPGWWKAYPSVATWHTAAAPPAAGGARGGEEGKEEGGGATLAAADGVLERLRKAQICQEFMQDSASQLTVHGLAQLHQEMSSGQLCIFFRNNHFAAMHKHGRELFLLCTDVGYYDKTDLVWERLADVNGDNAFYDSEFRLYDHSKANERRAASSAAAPLTVDAVSSALANIGSVPGKISDAVGEAAVAMGIPVVQSTPEDHVTPSQGYQARPGGGHDEDADLAMAMHLQAQFEEEERQAREQRQRAESASASTASALAQEGGGGRVTAGLPAGGAAGRGGGSAAARQRGDAAQLAEYQRMQRERQAQQQQQPQPQQQAQGQQQPAQPYYQGQEDGQRLPPQQGLRGGAGGSFDRRKRDKKDKCSVM